MDSLPRKVGLLGAVVMFCVVLLVALLGDYRPLAAAKKAVLSAAVLGGLMWICTHVGRSVVRDGMRRRDVAERT